MNHYSFTQPLMIIISAITYSKADSLNFKAADSVDQKQPSSWLTNQNVAHDVLNKVLISDFSVPPYWAADDPAKTIKK